MTSLHIKQALYDRCTSFVEERIQLYQKAMAAAQDAANQEEKSSAGDKYETTRAMMQIEKDQNAKQLEETIKLKKALSQINPQQTSDKAGLGSIVMTDKGNFFLAISMGKLRVDNTDYLVLAPTSPLGMKFVNLKAKEQTLFNGQSYTVLEVF